MRSTRGVGGGGSGKRPRRRQGGPPKICGRGRSHRARIWTSGCATGAAGAPNGSGSAALPMGKTHSRTAKAGLANAEKRRWHRCLVEIRGLCGPTPPGLFGRPPHPPDFGALPQLLEICNACAGDASAATPFQWDLRRNVPDLDPKRIPPLCWWHGPAWPNLATVGQSWPDLAWTSVAQCAPISAEVWPTLALVRRMLAPIAQTSANIGQVWSNVGIVSAESGQRTTPRQTSMLTNVDEAKPKMAETSTRLAETNTSLADATLNLDTSARSWSKSAQRGSKAAES